MTASARLSQRSTAFSTAAVRNGGVELGGALLQLPVAGYAEGFVGGVAVHVHHRGHAGGVRHVDHGVGVARYIHHVVLLGESI
jgi:hypothetical protein